MTIFRASALAAAALIAACTPDDPRPSRPARAAPVQPPPAAPVQTPAAPAKVAMTDAQAVWAEFRAAALSGDTARLLPLVRFPFKTRGTMDSDPTIQHSREEFPALFARLLAQKTGLDDSYTETERDLLTRTTRLPPTEVELLKHDQFRIGTFQFLRVDGAWKLTNAYTEELL